MTKHQRAGTLPVHRAVPARTVRTAVGPVCRSLAGYAVTRETDTKTPVTPTEVESQPETADELMSSELEEAREEAAEPGTKEEKSDLMGGSADDSYGC